MDELARQERSKYQRMAAREAYHGSFGLRFVEDAMGALGMSPGDRLWDFGTGTGKCVSAFRDAGIDAGGFDITRDRVTPEAAPFVTEAVLWSLPADARPRRFGFCSDVMEHIPPEKVEAVLGEISRLNEHAAYFTISLVPDNCGKLIGETLHLTVRPVQWWEERLVVHWPHVVLRAKGPANAVFVARK